MEALEEKISEVSVMRVGVMINTSMDEEFHEDSGKGLSNYIKLLYFKMKAYVNLHFYI